MPQKAPGFVKATLSALETIVLDAGYSLPERVAAGKLRLCAQASVRYNDLLKTPLSCCEWIRRPGSEKVVGLRSCTKRGKTGTRLWVASLRGVTQEGDGWLKELMSLLLRTHGDSWKGHDHLGKLAAPDEISFLVSPARLEVDVSLVKKGLESFRREGNPIGLSQLGLNALRWRGAKATFAALMQHLDLPARVVRFQGNWHSREDSMSDLYMRECQVLVLTAQEKCLTYLRNGGDLQTFVGTPLGESPVPGGENFDDSAARLAMAGECLREHPPDDLLRAFLDDGFDEQGNLTRTVVERERSWKPDKEKLDEMTVEDGPGTPSCSEVEYKEPAPAFQAPRDIDEPALQQALDSEDVECMVEALVQASSAVGAVKLHLPRLDPASGKLLVEPAPKCGLRGTFSYVMAEEAIDADATLCLRCWPITRGTERSETCSCVCGQMGLSARMPVTSLRCSRRCCLGSVPHDDHKCPVHGDA